MSIMGVVIALAVSYYEDDSAGEGVEERNTLSKQCRDPDRPSLVVRIQAA